MNILSSKRFLPLFLTQFLGAFNDNLFKNALVVLITFKITASAGMSTATLVSLCGALFVLSFLFFSGVAGSISAHYEKSKLIRWMKILEIIIMALASFGLIKHNIPLLLTCLFFMGLQSTLFGPIKYSILPQHLPDAELVKGNAAIQAATNMAILLGTILGGLSIMWNNGEVITSALIVFFAVLGLITSLKVPTAPADSPESVVSLNPVSTSKNIIQEIYKESPKSFYACVGISWFWFVGAAILNILPLLTKNFLGADNQVFTFFLACFCIGLGAGAIFSEKVARKTANLAFVIIGIFLMGFSFLMLGLFTLSEMQITQLSELYSSFDGIKISSALFLLSFSGGLLTVPLYTYIQQNAPTELCSKTIALNNIINALFMILASALTILFFAIDLSFSNIFFIFSLINFALWYYSYKKLRPYFWRQFSRTWSLFFKFKVKNEENWPPLGGSAIIVANHVSFIDWLIIFGTTPKPLRFVIDETYANLPFFGMFIKAAGCISIPSNGESKKRLAKGFIEINRSLKNNDWIVLFPEGTITRNGKLSPFKKGIENIVKKSRADVYPMAICGLWGSFFSRYPNGKAFDTKYKWREEATLNIGKKINNDDVSTEKIRESIETLLKEQE